MRDKNGCWNEGIGSPKRESITEGMTPDPVTS